MAIKKHEADRVEIQTVSMTFGSARFYLLGRSPLLLNSVGDKTRRELLFPRGTLTKADKANRLKHNPIEEYRASVYRRLDTTPGPTRLTFPASAPKLAMGDAALRMPGGVSKTETNQLCWAIGDRIPIWGIPHLRMAVVRMGDIARTPDIRTGAILPEWCSVVEIEYSEPVMTLKAVTDLMAAAGMICGIGDGRPQKGKLSFGQFSIVSEDHPDVRRLMRECGTEAQDAALESPVAYDADTESIFAWFTEEVRRRGKTAQLSGPTVGEPLAAKPNGAGRGRGRKAEHDEAGATT